MRKICDRFAFPTRVLNFYVVPKNLKFFIKILYTAHGNLKRNL